MLSIVLGELACPSHSLHLLDQYSKCRQQQNFGQVLYNEEYCRLRWITRGKWDYAGHLARIKDGRWNRRILQWRPWNGHRSRGRPITRWYDDIKKTAGLHWVRAAENRDGWQELREAYVQQWTQRGWEKKLPLAEVEIEGQCELKRRKKLWRKNLKY